MHVIDNRYIVLEMIKEGGFGIIHKGYDQQMDRPVAIKEVQPQLLGEVQFIDMFQDEALTTAKLSHSNIVNIYDLRKTTDNKFYIIMEYIDGVDLRVLIQKCQSNQSSIPYDIGVYITGEVCKALDYAHNKKNEVTGKLLDIIHRDISPSNIMVTFDGHVKVIDFGIAKVKMEYRKTDKTQTGIVKGKVPYMSPEQIFSLGDIDYRSDIFSLGVVMFEIFAGEKLFWHESDLKLRNMVAEARVDLSKFKKYKIPSALQRIILTAVNRNPERRYQSARLMYNDIHKYLQNESPSDLELQTSRFLRKFYTEGDISNFEIPQTHIPDEKTYMIETQALRRPAQLTPSDDQDETIAVPGNKYNMEEDVDLSGEKTEVARGVITPARQKPEFDSGGGDKTIFDRAFQIKRDYSFEFKVGTIVLAILFVIFLIIDTFTTWTFLGEGIHALFFPPSIRLSTVPGGAEVKIGTRVINGKTPMLIKNLEPGRHILHMELAGYEPLIRTIDIPQRGIQNLTYAFQSIFRFESIPGEAEIILNENILGQKTPFELSWDVDKDFQLAMRLMDFENPISNFEYHGITENPYIQDHRTWEFSKVEEAGILKFVIRGRFCRDVTINTDPDEAYIYVDDDHASAGMTNQGPIRLTLGNHKLTLKKDGYADKELSLVIDKKSNVKPMNIYLSREVIISAYEAGARNKGDIRAVILSKNGRLIRGKFYHTPTRLLLESRTYRLRICKPGYLDESITIRRQQNNVTVHMQKQLSGVIVAISDGITKRPIYNGEIFYRKITAGELFLNDKNVKQFNLFGSINANGTCAKKIDSGHYEFRAVSPGYTDRYKELNVYQGNERIDLVLLRKR